LHLTFAEKSIDNFSFFARKENLKIMKSAITLLLLAVVTMANAQDKPAYRVFNSEGKKADYGDIIKSCRKADIVFFGELHDDPIAHWLELEITKSLFEEHGTSLVLGAEMFEADNQLMMDEYLSGTYDASKFEAEVKLWKNYKTDYKPLVEFAKKNKLRFVATNIPRRYASVVNKQGFEGLSALTREAQQYIAPLPFPYDPEVKCYKDMLNMGGMGQGAAAHANENLPKAQAAKDATMAHFIMKNLGDGKKFIHYNGSYHSSNFEGIVWYLLKAKPDLTIVTIETVVQENTEKVETDNTGVATWIITVPSTMTRTY
jgi:uncharacterized iron-regulated protein